MSLCRCVETGEEELESLEEKNVRPVATEFFASLDEKENERVTDGSSGLAAAGKHCLRREQLDQRYEETLTQGLCALGQSRTHE